VFFGKITPRYDRSANTKQIAPRLVFSNGVAEQYRVVIEKGNAVGVKMARVESDGMKNKDLMGSQT
jgi:hypothetical protein